MKSIAADVLPYESAELQISDADRDVGFTLRYLDEGQGDETLLCVHGNPTWSFYYRRVVERFRDSHRVVAIDHLGCGRSDKPSRSQFGYTMADHVANLTSLVVSLDLKNVTLIAHDWGGAIGLSTLVAQRERFGRIVLLNTGAFPPPYIPKRIGILRTPWLGSFAIRGLNMFAGPAIKMAMSRNKLDRDAARGLLAHVQQLGKSSCSRLVRA